MVCIASRIGFSTRSTRSLCEAQIPIGIARPIESTTATRTWLRVSIASAHIPTTPITVRQITQSTIRLARRDARHANSAVAPTTIHHGRSWSRLRSGSSPYFVRKSPIAPVTPARCKVIQFTAVFVGPATEIAHPVGKSCCTRTSRPNDGSDHHDAERHHDRLVSPEHDRWFGQRQVHFPKALPVRGPEGVGYLEARRWHAPQAEAREADRRRQREDHGRDERRRE